MKRKAVSIIIISALLFIPFLFEGPLYTAWIRLSAMLFPFGGIDAAVFYLLLELSSIAIVAACILIAFKPYLNLKNVFKIAIAVLIFSVLNYFSSYVISYVISIICNILKIVVIIGLLFWVAKMRFNWNKKTIFTLIASFVTTVLGIALDIINGVIVRLQFSNLTEPNFYSFLMLFSRTSEIIGNLGLFLDYTSMCLIFAYIVLSIPEEVRIVEKKRVRETEDEVLPEVPEDMWRCMGCGEILPESQTECECGYKKRKQ